LVNNQQVGPIPVELRTGDEIRLGTQLVLQFEKFQSSMGGGDPDKTMEGFGVPSQQRPQQPHKGDETLIM